MFDLNNVTFILTLNCSSTAVTIASKEAKAAGLCCFSNMRKCQNKFILVDIRDFAVLVSGLLNCAISKWI